MLPLLSMMMPKEIGTSSRRKILMACSAPFSYTLKACWERLVTSLPFLSETLTGSTTRRVSVVNVTGPSGGGGVGCAPIENAAAAHEARANLLRRRIITEAVISFKRGQSTGLNQFNAYVAVFSIALLILR